MILYINLTNFTLQLVEKYTYISIVLIKKPLKTIIRSFPVESIAEHTAASAYIIIQVEMGQPRELTDKEER